MARPTKVQEVINKIERINFELSKNAADLKQEMFNIIVAAARDMKAPAASRMAAAKWVDEYSDKWLKENKTEEVQTQDGDSSDDYVDVSKPLINYVPEAKH